MAVSLDGRRPAHLWGSGDVRTSAFCHRPSGNGPAMTAINANFKRRTAGFSHLLCALSHFSCVRLSATLWTVARQAPLSMGFSRQEYRNGLLCPPPGDLPDPGIKPRSPALQAGLLPPVRPGKPLHASWRRVTGSASRQTSGSTCQSTGSTDRRDRSSLHGVFRAHWGGMWSVFPGAGWKEVLESSGRGDRVGDGGRIVSSGAPPPGEEMSQGIPEDRTLAAWSLRTWNLPCMGRGLAATWQPLHPRPLDFRAARGHPS